MGLEMQREHMGLEMQHECRDLGRQLWRMDLEMGRESCSMAAAAALESETCSGRMLVVVSRTLVVLETVRERLVCSCSLAVATRGPASMQHSHLVVLE